MPADADRPTLAIEISNPSMATAGVALGFARGPGEAARVIDEEPVASSSRHEDDLAPALDRMFRRAGLRPTDIGRVAVSVGPGGYTSMRMAVATGRMIAEVAGVGCVAVPSPSAAAIEIASQVSAWPLAVVMASKGETAYVTVFESAGDAWSARATGGVERAECLMRLGVATLASDGHLPASFAALAAQRGAGVIECRLSARACLAASGNRALLDPLRLVPLYARQPEAVTLWNARKNAGGR